LNADDDDSRRPRLNADDDDSRRPRLNADDDDSRRRQRQQDEEDEFDLDGNSNEGERPREAKVGDKDAGGAKERVRDVGGGAAVRQGPLDPRP
jgi:hypothetical protein